MSERIASTYVRVEFPRSVRKAAWERCQGRCEGCGRPLVKGGYTYDHTIPARRGGPSTLDNCKVLCKGPPDSCDAVKTYREDLPGIAAVKRYGKNRLPLDIDRPERKPGKIKSKGFANSATPIKSRGFDAGRYRPLPSRPFPQRRG